MIILTRVGGARREHLNNPPRRGVPREWERAPETCESSAAIRTTLTAQTNLAKIICRWIKKKKERKKERKKKRRDVLEEEEEETPGNVWRIGKRKMADMQLPSRSTESASARISKECRKHGIQCYQTESNNKGEKMCHFLLVTNERQQPRLSFLKNEYKSINDKNRRGEIEWEIGRETMEQIKRQISPATTVTLITNDAAYFHSVLPIQLTGSTNSINQRDTLGKYLATWDAGRLLQGFLGGCSEGRLADVTPANHWLSPWQRCANSTRRSLFFLFLSLSLFQTNKQMNKHRVAAPHSAESVSTHDCRHNSRKKRQQRSHFHRWNEIKRVGNVLGSRYLSSLLWLGWLGWLGSCEDSFKYEIITHDSRARFTAWMAGQWRHVSVNWTQSLRNSHWLRASRFFCDSQNRFALPGNHRPITSVFKQ